MKRKNINLEKIKKRKNKMASQKIKILFISRTYPPTTGGMEKMSFNLINFFSKLKGVKVTAIVNHRGKAFLPFFIVGLIPKIISAGRKYDLIHLSDAVLAPLGDLIKMFSPKAKVVCTVHGLDLTYAKKNNFYKKINLEALFSLDKIIAVSQATKKIALNYGAPGQKVVVIPNGINIKENYRPEIQKEELLRLLKTKLGEKITENTLQEFKNKVFLLTLGRLCKRKGIEWFIKNVLAKLDSQTCYLIAGGGKERENIQKAIKKLKLENKAFLLGFVSEKEKQVLLNTADIFVQPNIKVKNDMEGFGITLLEANSCNLPVVATGIEGITEAITDRKNGFLVKLKDVSAWKRILTELVENPEMRKSFGEKAKSYTRQNFRWEIIAKKYLEEFKKVRQKSDDQIKSFKQNREKISKQ
jgi:glycosyltransferase involved in cell wall biosynthesis